MSWESSTVSSETVEPVADEPQPVRRTGGMSTRALAQVLGVSASTVSRDLASEDTVDDQGRRLAAVSMVVGLDGKVRPSRRLDTAGRDAEIRRLRSAEVSMRAIAAAVGCSLGTVHRVLRQSGEQGGRADKV